MADIKTRAGEGRPLTNNEVDANFTNLNTDKAENGANTDITSLAGITGGVSTADYVDFDTLASGVARATGRLTWNDTDGCLEVGLKGSDVTQQIGQEMVTRVYNADSTTIANGEVVYFWSTAGEVIAGKKYIANATIDPHLIVGLATEDIAAGSYGYVTEFGFVRGLDTAAFNPGDILFCSPTVAGAIQSNEPSTPNDVVRIGICLESDSTNGIVLVNPHDVPRADEIRYDNADSGLASTNVKSAIDELELVKADISLLTSNVTFYLTSANDSVLAGYKQLVTSTLDTNYDEIAFDYLTSSISNTATMLQAWVSDVNVLVGDIAGIVVPIVGNIRKDTGSGDARFYFEVYIRESDGTETLVTTSNVSDYITSTIYGQISLSATVSLQTFTDTDRVVIKLYGQTDSSTAAYELQLGGSSPFRSLFPVPVSVVPSVANAYAIVADTTNFNGKLSSTDNNVQEALETLDDHVHQASEITGLTASNTTTNTSVFNGHLSATDTDIQKALNTLDDVDLQGITDVGATTTTAVTINASLDVDDLKLDGDTISNDGAAVDGNIVLSPKGAGEVDISKVDIDGGAIDGTTIGGTTPGAGTFTDLTVNTTATFAGATIADLGTVTTADINGGTIDGVALDATIADIDNIRIDGNSIISTDGNGNIDLTPNGLGEVNISKVDIAGGEIDGTTIGATVAAAGNFTDLDVSTTASFAGATIDDLGTVTTADINGGTIDGADITVGTGKTLSVINGTLTLADNQISGDKVHGGIISSFESQGIDDNATSTQLTITNTSASFAGDLAVNTDTLFVDVSAGTVGIGVADPDSDLEIYGSVPSLKISDSNAKSATSGATSKIEFAQHFGTQVAATIEPYQIGSATDYQKGGIRFKTNYGGGLGERLTIDEVGNIGIGNADPAYPLQIGDATDQYETLAITSTGSNGRSQIFMGDSNVDALRIVYWNEYDELTIGHDANVEFKLDSNANVSIANKLGVGQDAGLLRFMATGQSGFTIVGRLTSVSTASFLEFKDNDTTADYKVRVGSVADDMHLYAGGVPRIVVKDDGKVKIGQNQADPDTALEVYGVQSTAGTRTDGFDVLKITANYSGGDGQPYGGTAGTNGFGGGIVFENESYSGSFYTSAGIYSGITDNSQSTEGGSLNFYTTTSRGGSLERRLRIDHTGDVSIGGSEPASLVSGGSSPILSIGGTDSGLTTGDKVGTLSFITNDPSFTNTYADGITGEIASVAESTVGGAYGLHFYTGTTGSAGRGLKVRIDNNGNVGIGAPAVSGASAPLDVDKATPFNNCVANFGEFIALSGYQRGVVNINGRVNGTDYPASLSMVVRNPGNSNWFHGRIVYNNLNEFIIEKNGAGSSTGYEQFKIDAGGRQTITHNQYAYAQLNYHIKSATGTGNHYIGNVSGSMVLSSHYYYYGGGLRKLDAGETAGAEIIVGNSGYVHFGGIKSATAGSTVTRAYYGGFDSDGNWLVGDSSQVGNGKVGILKNLYNDGAGLAIKDSGTTLNGDYIDFLNSSNSIAGYIRHNGSTTVQYVTSSDVRLKENIVDAPAGNIDAIRVRSFDWKADGSHQTYGMVAQELVEVAPEAVSQARTDDDVWGIDYSKLIPMMIKEIQDLKAEVAALKGAN